MFLNTQSQLVKVFYNPVFLSGVFSWFCAQFIKTIIKLFTGKIHSVRELFEFLIWKTGGFPSSHTSLVTSMCTTIAFRSGISSDVFMLALCFLMITIRDALGVRRSSGIQARKINEIGNELDSQNIMKYKPIKEVQGHNPMEVVVGAILGFFIGVGFSVL